MPNNVSLPSITSDIPRDVRAFLDRVREALNGGVFLTVAEYERLQKAAVSRTTLDTGTTDASRYASLNGDEAEDFAVKDLTANQVLLRGADALVKIYRPDGTDDIMFHAGGGDQCKLTSEGNLLPEGSDKTLGGSDNSWANVWATALNFTDGVNLRLDNQTILFATNGADRWGIGGAGNLHPRADATYNVGGSGERAKEVWTTALMFDSATYIDDLSGELHFNTRGYSRWRVGYSGNLVPEGNHDVGLYNSRVNTVYADDVNYLDNNGYARSLRGLEARVAALESA